MVAGFQVQELGERKEERGKKEERRENQVEGLSPFMTPPLEITQNYFLYTPWLGQSEAPPRSKGREHRSLPLVGGTSAYHKSLGKWDKYEE